MYTISQLKPDLFTGVFAIIYRLTTQYFLYTQQIVPMEHYLDMLNRLSLEAEELQMAVARFGEAKTATPPQEGEFRWAALQLRRNTKSDMLTDSLVDGMDVLLNGKTIDKKFMSGYEAAVSMLNTKLSEIERLDSEGANVLHMQRDVNRVLEAYTRRKHGTLDSIPTGFNDIDEPTSGGYAPGDLVFYAAFTSQGKSTLAYGHAEDWAFRQRRNVVIGTAESSCEVVQRRLISMRSADKKYGFEHPLPYKLIKEGRLTSLQERQLELVVQDVNSNKDYGRISTFRIPAKAKGGFVFSILNTINQMFKIDVFIWDYIGYSHSDSSWKEKRHDVDQLIQDTKTMTGGFDGGRGIVTLSPFQVARYRWEQATKDGKYTLACMAEAGEAEKASDVVLSLLQMEQGTRAQLLKVRDGITRGVPFEIEFDPDTMRYRPKARIG